MTVRTEPPTTQQVAHEAVREAIRNGRLVPGPCAVDAVYPTQAHHPRGYEPPNHLDVVWLCARCHERIHGRSIATGSPSDLRAIRIAANMGLRELERLTGINRGRLSIIERGVVASQAETAAILAALTGKPKEGAA